MKTTLCIAAILILASTGYAQDKPTEATEPITSKTVFVRGSVRDTQMIKKALHLATEGPQACFQFTDYPQQATYTLYFRWDHRYTFFQSSNEATFELYDSKNKLFWRKVGRARSVGLYHQGHPERKIYPELFNALGCSYYADTPKQNKKNEKETP